MTRKKLIFILAATTALGALALSAARARDVPKVATGFVANVLCSETFVSGLEPDRIFAETTAAMPGVGLITWAMDYRVDRARKDVTVTLVRSRQEPRRLSRRRSRLLSRSRRRGRRHRAAAAKPSRPLQPEIAGASSSRRKARNLPPRSTAPLPSRTIRRAAAPGRSWS